jgi:hypothetical protein
MGGHGGLSIGFVGVTREGPPAEHILVGLNSLVEPY